MRIRQTPIPIRKLHQLRHPQKQVRSMQLITGILPRRMPCQIPHHQVLPSLPIQITIHQSPISHRQLFIMPKSQLTKPQQMPFPIFRRQSGQTYTKQLNGRPTPKLAQQSLQIFHKIFHFHDHRGNIYPCAAEGRIPHLYMDHQGIHKNRTGLLTSPKGKRRPVQISLFYIDSTVYSIIYTFIIAPLWFSFLANTSMEVPLSFLALYR